MTGHCLNSVTTSLNTDFHANEPFYYYYSYIQMFVNVCVRLQYGLGLIPFWGGRWSILESQEASLLSFGRWNHQKCM